MYGYVYKITNKKTGKCYIGQHKCSKYPEIDNYYWGSGKILKRVINKYGKENFTRDVLEWCKDKNSINKRELYWTEYYNAFVPNGYVLRGGCDNNQLVHPDVGRKISNANKGHTTSLETRKKISEAHKGKVIKESTKTKISKAIKELWNNPKYKEIQSNSHKGRKHTSEQIEKIRQGNMGKIYSEETRLKISKIHKDKKVSNETRKKMSESHKGQIPWNKGLKYKLKKELSNQYNNGAM